VLCQNPIPLQALSLVDFLELEDFLAPEKNATYATLLLVMSLKVPLQAFRDR